MRSNYVLEALGATAYNNAVPELLNLRRMGKSDAQITDELLKRGWSESQVNAAFAYLQEQAQATTVTASATMSRNTKLAIGAAAAIGAYVLFFRKGR